MGNLLSSEPVELESDICLLLVGKTGSGKSSTGNTILGRKVFPVDDTGDPVTYHALVQNSKRFNKTVTVVDGPGTLPAGKECAATRMEILVQSFYEGFKLCPRGFDVILLVMDCSSRFLKEDLQSIEILKKAFGEEFIRDHCILVFTRGESWELHRRATKSKNKTFEAWCKEQEGDSDTPIWKCERRILFYNLRPSREKETVSKLFSLLQTTTYKRYTKEKFDQRHRDCQSLIVEVKKEELTSGFRKEITDISDKLDNLQSCNERNEIVQRLNKLHNMTSRLQEKVNIEDRKTGVLREIMNEIETLLQKIENDQLVLIQCNRGI